MTYYHSRSRSGAMYFKSIAFLNLIVLTLGNPFHKYPYVFLLDVGNEELENANKEQIRVSAPGGSLALRYPAVGNGGMLSHVRVSGIDFGTDLKSNILEGGPGYNYVILLFMGNPGVPYDAVVTVQTLPNHAIGRIDTQKVDEVDNTTVGNFPYLLEGEVGNIVSPEDSANDKNNELVIEPSSKVYNFAQNNRINRRGDQSEDGKHYVEENNEVNNEDQSTYEDNSQLGSAKDEEANENNINAYRQYGADQVEHQNENKYVGNRQFYEDGQDKSQSLNNFDDSHRFTLDQLHKTQNNIGDSRQYDVEQDETQSQDNFDANRQYDKEQDRIYQFENDGEPAQSTNINNYNESEQQQKDNESSEAEQDSDSTDESYDGERQTNIAENNYSNYNALKALLYGYNSVLPEVTAGNEAYHDTDIENRLGNEEEGPIFNDEEVHNETGSDDNNNQLESDNGSAVA